MKIKKLAQRVFETYSKPLKTCWKLNNPADFDVIYYAPGTECLGMAQEVAAQVSAHYNHRVEVHTFRYIDMHTAQDFYPEDFAIGDIDISDKMLDALSRPKTLIVCQTWLKDIIQKQGQKQKDRLQIITPNLFYLHFCYEVDAHLDFGTVAESRTIKPVSRIIVWAEEPEVWMDAVRLWEYHNRDHEGKSVIITLIAITTNARYNSCAGRKFTELCKKCEAKYEIVSSLPKADIDESCLLVYSQRKSYLSDYYRRAVYYVVNEKLPCLWWCGGIACYQVLENVRKIAFEALLYASNVKLANEFLDTYKEEQYPRWRYAFYWWKRRVTMPHWNIV